MRVQMAIVGQGLLERGLYVLPFKGEQDELIVCAITAERRLTPSGVQALPWGANLDEATEALASELEHVDPLTDQIRRDILRVG
jgi:hypothetical protein